MINFSYPSITPTNIQSVIWNERIYDKLVDTMRGCEKEWSPDRLYQLPYLHLGINYIYKYRAFNPAHPEWTTEIFTDEILYSPSIPELNDPLEAAFICAEAAADPVIADGINMLMRSNWYGCICFTRDPICVQMWAHYAGSHEGYCIEYYRPSSFLLSTLCKPVLYRRTMPEITNLEQIEALFWTKSETWEYEAEWRLRYPRAHGKTAPGLLKPRGVIFGLRTPEEVKNLIRSCAGEIRFGQIVPAREPYRIKIKWE